MPDKQRSAGFALMAELQNYEQQGITIFLEGSPSSPNRVCEAVRVRESISFMRDYVFSEGALTEIRFDRIEES